jgi:hypothetical protein
LALFRGGVIFADLLGGDSNVGALLNEPGNPFVRMALFPEHLNFIADHSDECLNWELLRLKAGGRAQCCLRLQSFLRF